MNLTCKCPFGFEGHRCENKIEEYTPQENSTPQEIMSHDDQVFTSKSTFTLMLSESYLQVIGISILCVAIIVFLMIILLSFRRVKKARATRGTYSPSAQEMFGNSVIEILKPPPKERLI